VSVDTTLGLDLGTGSVKALLLDRRGGVRGEAARSYTVKTPRPGWAESEPAHWWTATVEAVHDCLQAAQASHPEGIDVVAIGLSGQMHGVVLCREDGTVVRPAILWADGRARETLDAYKSLPPEALRRLGNPVTVGMAGPNLVWLLRHEPESIQTAHYALQPKDWLRLILTGRVAAEPSDASATLLYDLVEDRWSEEVVAGLGIPKRLLAPLSASRAESGRLSGPASAALALPAALPVATGGADTACAIYGSGLGRAGEVQLSIGTGMQLVALRSQPRVDISGRTHLFRSVEEGWYVMSAMQNGGLALEWVRRLLQVDWDTLYAEAFAAPAGSEGVTFLPYLTGERTPIMDPDAQGTFAGLTLRHHRGHLARAAFEGVALALRDGLDALEATGAQARCLLLVGGGSLRSAWRHLLADVLQRPLDAVDVPSASARGAALLGWRARGYSGPPPPSSRRVAEPRPADELDRAFARFQQCYGEERRKRPPPGVNP